MEIDTDWVFSLLTGIIIAIITAYFTVRFSLKQFYSQQWWQKKAEAYTNIMESLYSIRRYYSSEVHAMEMASEISEE